MRLLLDWRWVHRRVELIRFVDAATVHRQMSVDFTMPSDSLVGSLRTLHPRLVVLAMLKKRELARFSVWDEDGRRLPIYTTEQNGYYAAAALVALVRVAVAEAREHPDHRSAIPTDDAEVPEVVFEAFRRVAHEQADKATLVLACLKEGLQQHEERLGELSAEAHARNARVDGDEVATWSTRAVAQALVPYKELTQDLLKSPGLAHIAEQLADQFIVLTELTGEQSARRIVKFSYEQPQRSYRPQRLPLLVRLLRPPRMLFEGLSWWHRTITLDKVPVGTSRSYHVELEAPDDIEFIGARLTAEDPGRDDDTPYRARSTTTESQRVHLQVSDAPRAVTGPVWAQVRVARAGFVRAAVTLSLLVAALLWVGQDQVEPIARAPGGAEGPAALLLVVPTLLAALLVRPGEHAMASSLLFGVRVLLAMSAGCALVAAGAIAGGFELDTQQSAWDVCKWTATCLAGALVLSYLMPYVTPVLSRATTWGYEEGRQLAGKLTQTSKKADSGSTI